MLGDAVGELVPDHVVAEREVEEDLAVAIAIGHLRAVPEGVVVFYAVMDRGDQRHVIAVDRIALEDVPIEFGDILGFDIGALDRAVGRRARIGHLHPRQRRRMMTIEDMRGWQQVRERERDRAFRERKLDRRQRQGGVLLAQRADMPAERRGMVQRGARFVGKFGIGCEPEQDVVRNDAAATSHVYPLLSGDDAMTRSQARGGGLAEGPDRTAQALHYAPSALFDGKVSAVRPSAPLVVAFGSGSVKVGCGSSGSTPLADRRIIPAILCNAS